MYVPSDIVSFSFSLLYRAFVLKMLSEYAEQKYDFGVAKRRSKSTTKWTKKATWLIHVLLVRFLYYISTTTCVIQWRFEFQCSFIRNSERTLRSESCVSPQYLSPDHTLTSCLFTQESPRTLANRISAGRLLKYAAAPNLIRVYVITRIPSYKTNVFDI